MSIKTIFFLHFFILSLWAQERIVSLSPSITEIVYALGKGESLVATSAYSLYPKEAQKLPVVGGYESPSLEKILSHAPTLVLGQSYNTQPLEKLEQFHIKTVALHLKTLEDIQNSITLLGDILDAKTQAKQLLTNITNAITNAAKSQKQHSVMIVYGLKEDLRNGIYIAGHNIFFEDIITACGNTNAYTATSTEQPVLSYENVIALNPDQIIILHSHATEPNVDVKKALANWYTLPTNAAKEKKISIVDEAYLHIPSQRVADTVTRLCKEMND
jgi:iron complex transport system substrate-binding protein